MEATQENAEANITPNWELLDCCNVVVTVHLSRTLPSATCQSRIGYLLSGINAKELQLYSMRQKVTRFL